MALAFETVRIEFPSTRATDQSKQGIADFSRVVNTADASLKSFHMQYTESDHNLWLAQFVVRDISKDGTKVSFWVDYLLRDSSGNIDDPYEGWADVLVTADVE
jgi:hypothetical protein